MHASSAIALEEKKPAKLISAFFMEGAIEGGREVNWV